MRINAVSFAGKLYLKNPELWTPEMKRAIDENESIQKKLRHHDVIGEISAKREKNIPQYYSLHRKGDLIYKAGFLVRKEDATLADKIKGKIDKTTKRYTLSQHYHSEYTTVDRIQNLKMV